MRKLRSAITALAGTREFVSSRNDQRPAVGPLYMTNRPAGKHSLTSTDLISIALRLPPLYLPLSTSPVQTGQVSEPQRREGREEKNKENKTWRSHLHCPAIPEPAALCRGIREVPLPVLRLGGKKRGGREVLTWAIGRSASHKTTDASGSACARRAELCENRCRKRDPDSFPAAGSGEQHPHRAAG